MKNIKVHHFCNGQSVAEYVILIAIVSAALLAMQTYMKRGIQGAIRVAADQAGRQEDVNQDITDEYAIRLDTNSFDISNVNERTRTFTGGGQRTDSWQDNTSFQTWTTISKEDK